MVMIKWASNLEHDIISSPANAAYIKKIGEATKGYILRATKRDMKALISSGVSRLLSKPGFTGSATLVQR